MSEEYRKYSALCKEGRHREAARFAQQQYFEGDPNNPFWLTRQAAELIRVHKYKQALDTAEQALSLNPSHPYSILAVADALRGLHRLEEALTYYEALIGNPKLSNSAQRGMLFCFSELKQWDRILNLLNRWEVPQHIKFQWKAKALAGQKRLNEAIEVCRQWLAIQPDLPQGLWMLTDLEIERDGLEPVLNKMGRLAKISSRPPIYKEIYASLCRKAGKPELALKTYEKLTRASSDINVQRQQAFALKKSGKMSEAIPMMEELLKIDPKDIYIHSSYVSACKKTDQLERVLKFYEKLIERYPEETTLYGRIRKIKNLLKGER